MKHRMKWCELQKYKWNEDVAIAVVIAIWAVFSIFIKVWVFIAQLVDHCVRCRCCDQKWNRKRNWKWTETLRSPTATMVLCGRVGHVQNELDVFVFLASLVWKTERSLEPCHFWTNYPDLSTYVSYCRTFAVVLNQFTTSLKFYLYEFSANLQ